MSLWERKKKPAKDLNERTIFSVEKQQLIFQYSASPQAQVLPKALTLTAAVLRRMCSGFLAALTSHLGKTGILLVASAPRFGKHCLRRICKEFLFVIIVLRFHFI